MKQMAEHVPDAAAYAPVTVLIDERADGVHVSYDRMTSFLTPYGNAAASKVAQDLDAKIENLFWPTPASNGGNAGLSPTDDTVVEGGFSRGDLARIGVLRLRLTKEASLRSG